jgi:hypothetical protein
LFARRIAASGESATTLADALTEGLAATPTGFGEIFATTGAYGLAAGATEALGLAALAPVAFFFEPVALFLADLVEVAALALPALKPAHPKAKATATQTSRE